METKCIACEMGEFPLKGRLREFGKKTADKISLIRGFHDVLKNRGVMVEFDLPWAIQARNQTLFNLEKIAYKTVNVGPHAHQTTGHWKNMQEMPAPFLEEWVKFQERYLSLYKPVAEEFDQLARPFVEFLEKCSSKYCEMVRSLPGINDGGGEESQESVVKNFQEVKTITMGKGKEKDMENKFKMFKNGKWIYAETEGQELGDRIKEYMEKHPAVVYLDAAVFCEKEMKEETEKSGTVQQFGEERAGKVNPDVPASIVREFSEKPTKAASILLSRDGKYCKTPRGEILPVYDNAKESQEIEAFLKDPLRIAGKKLMATREKIDAGFSADGKSHTDRQGNMLPTDKSDEETAAVFSFQLQHARVFDKYSIHHTKRNAAAKKAMSLLDGWGLEPMSAKPSEASYAIEAAASSDEKFDAATRYLASKAFETFEKSIVAAIG